MCKINTYFLVLNLFFMLKISNLKSNFNSSSKTLGENLIVDDKTYENQRINNVNSNLDSAASTIRDNIIPRIKRKIEN